MMTRRFDSKGVVIALAGRRVDRPGADIVRFPQENVPLVRDRIDDPFADRQHADDQEENARDEDAFRQFSSRCEDARAQLLRHMADRGLLAEDGWRIFEFTRQVGERLELVARPVHHRLPAPPDLECACIIDEARGDISAECRS